MILQKLLNRLSLAKVNLFVYLLEVFLIIFSILIAIQADRYQQRKREQVKLDNYIQAMHQDLLDEQESNRMNLFDCRRDLQNIERSLRLSQINQDDSLSLALQNFGEVVNRGVFRPFPPTTLDIMLSTGDIALIKDLELRSLLASVFSFRDTYLKKDLLDFDEQIRTVSHELAKYGNLSCMYATPAPQQCLTDRKGFVDHFHNQLFILYRTTQLRAFHLGTAVNYFAGTIDDFEQAYGLEKEKTPTDKEKEPQ